jgi:hypothetical protein
VLVNLAVLETRNTNIISEADEGVELVAVKRTLLLLHCTTDSGFKLGKILLKQSLASCLADGSFNFLAMLRVAV